MSKNARILIIRVGRKYPIPPLVVARFQPLILIQNKGRFVKAELLWSDPLLLQNHPQLEDINLSDLPEFGGIYTFSRMFGEKENILYIGMAKNIKVRIKQQFNNRKLMDGIQQAARGQRRLRYATFKTRQADTEAALRLVEKELIRHFIDEGHPLLNKQGTIMSFHVITNSFDSDDSIWDIPDAMHILK